VDNETFIDRLRETGSREDCVMCGQNDWRGFGEAANAERVALPTPLPDGSYHTAHGHGAYGMACANCGFIRLHAVSIIAPEEGSP
jgi:hypothetical protein